MWVWVCVGGGVMGSAGRLAALAALRQLDAKDKDKDKKKH